MRLYFTVVFVVIVLTQVFSQKMFETELADCPVKFIMEDSELAISYITGDSLLILDFLAGFEEKQIAKFKGVVMMQVMIDTANQVCCVSYTNKSTISDKKLNVSNRLKNMSGWTRITGYLPNENICALVSIVFDKKEFTIIRTGYNRNKGRKILYSTTYKRFVESDDDNETKLDTLNQN